MDTGQPDIFQIDNELQPWGSPGFGGIVNL